MFNNLRETNAISRGIYYVEGDNGELKRVSTAQFLEKKVEVEGFIIGMGINRSLRKIYDINRVNVIVKNSNFDNIPLDPFYAEHLPFNAQLRHRTDGNGQREPYLLREIVSHPLLGNLRRRID